MGWLINKKEREIDIYCGAIYVMSCMLIAQSGHLVFEPDWIVVDAMAMTKIQVQPFQ